MPVVIRHRNRPLLHLHFLALHLPHHVLHRHQADRGAVVSQEVELTEGPLFPISIEKAPQFLLLMQFQVERILHHSPPLFTETVYVRLGGCDGKSRRHIGREETQIIEPRRIAPALEGETIVEMMDGTFEAERTMSERRVALLSRCGHHEAHGDKIAAVGQEDEGCLRAVGRHSRFLCMKAAHHAQEKSQEERESPCHSSKAILKKP